ncbi:MAG: hypothetical protein H6568_14900 [Lewinellaceae bacterium]|mgnify:CR=1 FL=1|nr:hypothetical protein [Saprospiraceae bacterium]MCB9314045.1 hypothetical protein [Lewinellaceae bacterium]HRW75192.1 hypothetical protein [Saprospiraceae bacterium]
MIRRITTLILAPCKDNQLILGLILGFAIMVGGSWLNSRQAEVASEQDRMEQSPSTEDAPGKADMRMYATLP